MPSKNTFIRIQEETRQDHSLRLPLLRAIQRLRGGKYLISFFISFHHDTALSQIDSDMIQEVLIGSDTSKGITLILDAPGGDGLAAERIIEICRSFCSAKGAVFETIVPARSKSAATMVCLGSDQIVMSPTSELGPIDPQIPYRGNGDNAIEWIPAHHLIKTYDELMQQANTTSGHIEPYLQQLQRLNATSISQMRAAQQLAESIAISSLKKGMLKGKSDATIKKSIKPFLEPDLTFSHGRALNHESCKACGLKVELVGLDSELWKTVWGLYMRSTHVISSQRPKLLETTETAFAGG